jgi:hypothetical protein
MNRELESFLLMDEEKLYLGNNELSEKKTNKNLELFEINSGKILKEEGFEIDGHNFSISCVCKPESDENIILTGIIFFL